jgi:hypothetical protein
LDFDDEESTRDTITTRKSSDGTNFANSGQNRILKASVLSRLPEVDRSTVKFPKEIVAFFTENEKVESKPQLPNDAFE